MPVYVSVVLSQPIIRVKHLRSESTFETEAERTEHLLPRVYIRTEQSCIASLNLPLAPFPTHMD